MLRAERASALMIAFDDFTCRCRRRCFYGDMPLRATPPGCCHLMPLLIADIIDMMRCYAALLRRVDGGMIHTR